MSHIPLPLRRPTREQLRLGAAAAALGVLAVELVVAVGLSYYPWRIVSASLWLAGIFLVAIVPTVWFYRRAGVAIRYGAPRPGTPTSRTLGVISSLLRVVILAGVFGALTITLVGDKRAELDHQRLQVTALPQFWPTAIVVVAAVVTDMALWGTWLLVLQVRRRRAGLTWAQDRAIRRAARRPAYAPRRPHAFWHHCACGAPNVLRPECPAHGNLTAILNFFSQIRCCGCQHCPPNLVRAVCETDVPSNVVMWSFDPPATRRPES